jgi:hypothetical protein
MNTQAYLELAGGRCRRVFAMRGALLQLTAAFKIVPRYRPYPARMDLLTNALVSVGEMIAMRTLCRATARGTQSDERAIAYGGIAAVSLSIMMLAHFIA